MSFEHFTDRIIRPDFGLLIPDEEELINSDVIFERFLDQSLSLDEQPEAVALVTDTISGLLSTIATAPGERGKFHEKRPLSFPTQLLYKYGLAENVPGSIYDPTETGGLSTVQFLPDFTTGSMKMNVNYPGRFDSTSSLSTYVEQCGGPMDVVDDIRSIKSNPYSPVPWEQHTAVHARFSEVWDIPPYGEITEEQKELNGVHVHSADGRKWFIYQGENVVLDTSQVSARALNRMLLLADLKVGQTKLNELHIRDYTRYGKSPLSELSEHKMGARIEVLEHPNCEPFIAVIDEVYEDHIVVRPQRRRVRSRDTQDFAQLEESLILDSTMIVRAF